jgi:serine/threonine protein kinase
MTPTGKIDLSNVEDVEAEMLIFAASLPPIPPPANTVQKKISRAVERWCSGSQTEEDDRYVIIKKVTNTVYFAASPSGAKVVIKTTNTTPKASKPKSGILREKLVLESINHPYIPKLLDYHSEGLEGTNINTPCLILEYTEGVDLYDFIVDHEPLPLNLVRTIFSRILSGMVYVHSTQTIHRDLKPENIIYDHRTQNIKIIDWEFAYRNVDTPDVTAPCGSLHYIAPETYDPVLNNIVIGTINDIWSLGVVLYALLSKNLPFDGDEPRNILDAGTNFQINYDRETIPESSKKLLKRILVHYQSRASLFEISRDPWMLSMEEERSGGVKKIENIV